MSIMARIETAFTFIELLKQTERARYVMEQYHEWDVPPSEIENTSRTLRIANATWVRRLIDVDLNKYIEAALAQTRLQRSRNAYSNEVSFVSPGVLDGLRDIVREELAVPDEDSDSAYHHDTACIAGDTYLRVFREGLLDWDIRTGSEEGYEVRCCAMCGTWYEPQLRARSRFCSGSCRKRFNNQRSSNDPSLSSFQCKGCGEMRSLDEFAGLFFVDEPGTVTPLRMSNYVWGSEGLCCLHCVKSQYREWRAYIAPMESLSERATA